MIFNIILLPDAVTEWFDKLPLTWHGNRYHNILGKHLPYDRFLVKGLGMISSTKDNFDRQSDHDAIIIDLENNGVCTLI